MHVVKAFASEDFERAKYNRKAEELRVEYYDAERMQGTNSAWMTLYFTFALGVIPLDWGLAGGALHPLRIVVLGSSSASGCTWRARSPRTRKP